jgi:[acyl-carrier-protein] S-malonyltransferase
MAAVLGLSDEGVEGLCAAVEDGVCVPANFNSEGQVVISGDRAGIADAQSRAADVGAKKVIELNVSGAFHSPLMAPAAEGLAQRLASTDFRDPAIPVISNVTAAPIRSGDEARSLLVEQLTSPVRWSASIARMLAEGVEGFAELGAGKVLCGLNRRNARGVPCSSLGSPDDVQLYLAASEEAHP